MRTKTFKKSIACTLAAFLAAVSIPVCTASATTTSLPTFDIADVEGMPGQTVSVALSTSSTLGEWDSIETTQICLDNGLEYKGTSGLAGAASFNSTLNEISFNYVSTGSERTGDICYFNICIPENANPGDVYNIDFKYDQITYTNDFKEYTIPSSNLLSGSIKVVDYELTPPAMNYYFSDDTDAWTRCSVMKYNGATRTDAKSEVTFSAASPADAWTGNKNNYTITAYVDGMSIGSFPVKIGLRGDFNNDYNLSTSDATLIFSYLADKSAGKTTNVTPFQLFVGDVNENSYNKNTATASTTFNVTTSDGTYILSYLSAKSSGQNPTWYNIIHG